MNGESKQSPRRLYNGERQAQALELRKAGATYEMIAERLGYAGPGVAYNAIEAALKKIITPPAEEVRKLELERLDALLLAMWQQGKQGNQGAIDRVIKIMERRARLLGLDAPVKQEVNALLNGGVTLRWIGDGDKDAAPTSGADGDSAA